MEVSLSTHENEADNVDTFGGMRGILGAFILFVHDCRKQLQSKEN
jgi:hypothetical protein